MSFNTSKSLAFTICSNNYLAQALTLVDSFKRNNPEIPIVICLMDKLQNVKSLFNDIQVDIIEIEDIVGDKIYDLAEIYNIIELNTAVKASVFKYFFKNYKNIENLIYLDPDIMFFGNISELLELQSYYNCILTPHITSPNNGEYGGQEEQYLMYGIFNLGFLSLTRCSDTKLFLDWWESKKYNGGASSDVSKHVYTDQLWANMAVAFFKNFFVLKNPGYNMAHWNLHERKISINNNDFYVNKEFKLVFFHFSGYKIENHDMLPYSAIKLSDRKDLKPVFDIYQKALYKNNVMIFSKYPCFYIHEKSFTKRNYQNLLNKIVLSIKKLKKQIKTNN